MKSKNTFTFLVVFYLLSFLCVLVDSYSENCENGFNITNQVKRTSGYQEYLSFFQSCVSSGLTRQKLEAHCDTNATDYQTQCTNFTGNLCHQSFQSNNSTSFSVDLSYFICLPKACNSSDISSLENSTHLTWKQNNSFSIIFHSTSITVVNSENSTTLSSTITTKCGGISAGIILLIVVLLCAVLLVVFVVVIIIIRRRRADDLYTPISTTGDNNFA